MLASAITVKHLSVQAGSKTLLQIPEAKFPCQKITCIIGANGAGKSTLIHALLGHISGVQITGDILWQGQPLSTLVSQGKIAWVGQHERFELPLTVLEYAVLGAIPNLAWYEKPNAPTLAMAEQKLADFGLSHLKHNRLEKLSGGEKQRLAMVRALMQNTDIILLDEPTNHLDIKHQRLLFDYLAQLTASQQKTIVMVLHSLSHAYQFSDWVIALHEGELLAQGIPTQVMTEQNLATMYGVAIGSVMTEQGRIFY